MNQSYEELRILFILTGVFLAGLLVGLIITFNKIDRQIEAIEKKIGIEKTE